MTALCVDPAAQLLPIPYGLYSSVITSTVSRFSSVVSRHSDSPKPCPGPCAPDTHAQPSTGQSAYRLQSHSQSQYTKSLSHVGEQVAPGGGGTGAPGDSHPQRVRRLGLHARGGRASRSLTIGAPGASSPGVGQPGAEVPDSPRERRDWLRNL